MILFVTVFGLQVCDLQRPTSHVDCDSMLAWSMAVPRAGPSCSEACLCTWGRLLAYDGRPRDADHDDALASSSASGSIARQPAAMRSVCKRVVC